MKQQIFTSNAPEAIGPYSQAISTGNTVFVSGQLGIDPGTGKLVEGGVEAQTRRALTNIRSILEQVGLSMSSVVKTTCLLADIGDFATFNEIYAEFFSVSPAPARSAFAVKALPKGALVEIEAIAARE
ncbi:MAG: RidA family protein [Bacteroidales bacterium]|nr:RidA family protein [Bacteroidales bacterium]